MGAIQSAINRSLVTTSALVGLYKQSVKMDEEKMKQATERSENQKIAKIKQRANLQNQRARLTEAREASEAAKNAYNDIAGRVHAMENAISINYVQYIGSDNLNHDSILRMIELLESGEAVSVSDAAARLKGGR